MVGDPKPVKGEDMSKQERKNSEVLGRDLGSLMSQEVRAGWLLSSKNIQGLKEARKEKE